MHRSTPKYVLAAVASIALVSACARSPRAVQNGGAAVGSGAMAAAAKPALPAAVTPANVALGDSLFNSGGCQRCHGQKGVGAPNGPALDGQKWVQLQTGSFEEIVGIITTGVPATAIKDPTRKNAMRPRGGNMQLTDPQIQAVAAYVYTLTHK
ncbi:MAG: cytochrome c [Gemmatimonadota bacterium]